MHDVVAGCLLVHACYTDLRWRVIRNWAVAAAGLGGLVLGLAGNGAVGLRTAAEGLALGAGWWLAVACLKLGPGDAKLAMAIGATLGPAAALVGPSVGYVLCALALLPWIAWRRVKGRPWRDVALPMAPWIAVGTAVVVVLRAGGLWAGV